MDPRPAPLMDLAPGIRRLIAPNPSAFTYWGTNTYLYGTGKIAVIDPGPDDPAHMAAILAALRPGEEISHILVTHSHRDHSPLSAPLGRVTGAPVLAYGTSRDGITPVMQKLAASGLLGGGEGADPDFVPDHTLADGEIIRGETWQLTAHWTPGHFGNHLSFETADVAFSGDLVMGWSTSIVSPPDGDLTDFMASCRAMRARAPARLFPGHGDPIETPADRLTWLIDHRNAREAAILAALRAGPATLRGLTAGVYTDIAPNLLPAAERNVLAHLIDLEQKNMVAAEPELSVDALFSLC